MIWLGRSHRFAIRSQLQVPPGNPTPCPPHPWTPRSSPRNCCTSSSHWLVSAARTPPGSGSSHHTLPSGDGHPPSAYILSSCSTKTKIPSYFSHCYSWPTETNCTLRLLIHSLVERAPISWTSHRYIYGSWCCLDCQACRGASFPANYNGWMV